MCCLAHVTASADAVYTKHAGMDMRVYLHSASENFNNSLLGTIVRANNYHFFRIYCGCRQRQVSKSTLGVKIKVEKARFVPLLKYYGHY